MLKNRFLMLIILTLLITICFSVPVFGATEFDANKALAHTQVLAEKIGPRPAASAQEYSTGEYLREKFVEYGWQVKSQEFSRVLAVEKLSLKKFSLVNSRNIVAVRPGQSSDTIIIGAHYDSADFNVPGANDNGSGVGVLLEVARVLGQQPQEYTYVLVGFGAEELGLLGSKYFVENYDLDQVKLMLNLDMIGQGKKVALDGGGKISAPPALLNKAYKEAKKYGLQPVVQRDFMLMARASKEGGTSDFSPFLDKWIPALGLGQGDRARGYYHQPSDTMDKVNVETLGAYGNLVLSLAKQGSVKYPEHWDDGYLTLDTGVMLIFLPPLVLKGFVVLAMAMTLGWLIRRRNRNWISLVWFIPGLLGLLFVVLFAAYLPELLLRKLKGLAEAWHGAPAAYVALRGLSVVIILSWLYKMKRWLPRKVMPETPEGYLAGSMVLLGLGVGLVLLGRWDVAFYFAFWLVFIPYCSTRFGLVFAVGAPALVYSFHWQLLNSHMWNDLYRSATEHYVIASFIYAMLLLPLVLSILGWLKAFNKPFNVFTTRGMFVALAAVFLVCMLIPAYDLKSPQEITVRQEWKEKQLNLQVSSKEKLPLSLAQELNSKTGVKEIKQQLPGSGVPALFKLETSEAKLKDERLVTVNVSGSYQSSPYLVKLKLTSDKPFTMVNGGDFFPLGKLANKVRLTGEAFRGVYGLILERYEPIPPGFSLYLKAQGKVLLSIESQYPTQFVKREFQVPAAMIKYENWVVYSQQI